MYNTLLIRKMEMLNDRRGVVFREDVEKVVGDDVATSVVHCCSASEIGGLLALSCSLSCFRVPVVERARPPR
jgi:hypothetical protein